MATNVTMAGYSAGADQLGFEQLAFFQVIGQALQHHSEIAALFTGGDHGDVDVVKLPRMLPQRSGKWRTRVDLRLEIGHEIAQFFRL
jgi:hypothetical protein